MAAVSGELHRLGQLQKWTSLLAILRSQSPCVNHGSSPIPAAMTQVRRVLGVAGNLLARVMVW